MLFVSPVGAECPRAVLACSQAWQITLCADTCEERDNERRALLWKAYRSGRSRRKVA